jgi:hypothetical protein
MMPPNTCPCCEVSQPPHRDGCTFNKDCPISAADFDEVSVMRAEIARLREERRWIPVGERLPEVGVAYEVAAVRRGDYGYTEDEACITFAEYKLPSWASPGGWIETVASPRYSNGLKVTHYRKRTPGPEGKKPELPTG